EILEYEAGRSLAMTWHPGNNADNPTRVSVTFEQIADNSTRVTLTHSGWEIWGDAAADKRENYDTGWDFVLGARYVAATK
ncbi:MAG: SRPBCC domain-containing protein, partial [Pseudomonadota bacterium]